MQIEHARRRNETTEEDQARVSHERQQAASERDRLGATQGGYPVLDHDSTRPAAGNGMATAMPGAIGPATPISKGAAVGRGRSG